MSIGSAGRTCWTKQPNGCTGNASGLLRLSAQLCTGPVRITPLKVRDPSRGSKQPMLPGAVSVSVWLKFPKVVNAAVLPVLLMASRLSGARPPPVVVSSDVNSKFVSVERAARETFDAQVEPPGHVGPKSPLLLIASAVFKWQPTQAG